MARVVSLAWANLFHERSKITLSVGGVVLSVFLIFTVTGLYNALDNMMENIVLEADADLWVTSKGASGSFHSPSLLSLDLKEQIEGVEGVARVAPLIRQPMTTQLGGEQALIYLNGYDTASGMGGPWKIVEGAGTPGPGEAVVDRVLAAKYDLEVGGTLQLEGRSFKIVGLSDETSLMIAYMVFVTFQEARAFLPENLTNFFLVQTAPQVPAAQVAQALEAGVEGVSASGGEATAQAYKNELLGGFLPILYVISLVGVFVGVMVIGMMLYTLTVEKSSEYGILKAVGATNGYLYRIVLGQAMLISILGFILGALVSVPLLDLISYLVPEFISRFTSGALFMTFGLFVATGLLASFIPVKRLAGIDPAQVFKG